MWIGAKRSVLAVSPVASGVGAAKPVKELRIVALHDLAETRASRAIPKLLGEPWFAKVGVCFQSGDFQTERD